MIMNQDESYNIGQEELELMRDWDQEESSSHAVPRASLLPSEEPPVTVEAARSDTGQKTGEPFPSGQLPSVLAQMVTEAARVHQVPETMTGPAVLAAVSASLGRNLQVASGRGRTTTGNVYILVSAESGVGKSAICGCLLSPIFQYESHLRQHWEKEIRPKAEAERDLLEAEINDVKRTKPGGRPDTEMERRDTMGIMREKRLRLEELKKQLVTPRLVVENVTSEALSGILASLDETIFSCSADASDVFGVLRGGYKKEGSDENIYLKGWSGDHVNVDRVNRPPVSLEHPCISALWMTQPRRVEDLFNQRSFVDGGLLPRFMVCHGRGKPMPLASVEPPPVDEQVMACYQDLVGDLVAEYRLDEATPKVMEVEPAASQVMRQFFNGIVERRNNGDLQDLGVFAARWGEWAWRVSVILHAAQWGNRAHQNPLTAETAVQAVNVTQWFVGEQLALLEDLRHQTAQEQLRGICELLEKNPAGITSRMVQRKRICATANEARETLERLVAQHCLIKSIRPTAGARRGNITVYLAGPEL
jgi:hypothetical protein